MRVEAFSHSMAQTWDGLVELSMNGTFLHSRRFLSHNAHRFTDASCVVFEGNRVVGVFPAAIEGPDGRTACSHPGATYGGLVHQGHLRGERMRDALGALANHYRSRGFEQLIFRSTPWIYHRQPSEDMDYFLADMGAHRVQRGLNCALRLDQAVGLSKRKDRNLRRASNLLIQDHAKSSVPHFYQLLVDTLEQQHGVAPAHTLTELQTLVQECAHDVELLVATDSNSVVAGTLLFKTSTCWHSQYVASSAAGREVGAVDACLVRSLERARAANAAYFSFGVSTEPATGNLNEGLYRFKSEFGGGGVVHSQWTLDLGSLRSR